MSPHTRFKALVAELIAITRGWNAHDLMPPDQQGRVHGIGAELNMLGGIAAMTNAYYAVKQRNRYAAALQHEWAGIGDWLP